MIITKEYIALKEFVSEDGNYIDPNSNGCNILYYFGHDNDKFLNGLLSCGFVRELTLSERFERYIKKLNIPHDVQNDDIEILGEKYFKASYIIKLFTKFIEDEKIQNS